MKQSYLIETSRVWFVMLCALITMLPQCTKPKVHYLQPLTENTFESRELVECWINGRYFRARAIDSASLGSITYRPEYTGTQGHKFELSANMHVSSCVFSSINIYLDSIELKQGRTYRLGTPGSKKNYATYFSVKGCSQNGTTLYTSDELYAEVFITRVDFNKKVVLGTFDLRMYDTTGAVIRFSDGFFDRHFRN